MSSSVLYSPVLNYIESLKVVLLSPLLSGPLLLAVATVPDAVRDVLNNLVSQLPARLATTPPDLQHVQSILRIWFAVSLIRQVNGALNTMAHNAWRIRAAPGWNWPDEIAVITGGSGGIGECIVLRLIARGVRVAVLDIQELPKSLQDNPLIRFYRCDLTSSESVAEAADAVRRDIGHPTIVINNAGVTSPMPILKMPEAFLRKIFSVNCMALWLTTQQFLPRMIQLNKGHVITVASLSSFVGLPTAADYSATKAGAHAFHESLTSELKHYYKAPNVMTTIVHPNFVRTALIEDFAERLEHSGVKMLTPDEIAKETVAQIFSRRAGQIIVPKSATLVSGIRGWPTWLQEILRDMLGRSSLTP